jgi:hypothetical protein
MKKRPSKNKKKNKKRGGYDSGFLYQEYRTIALRFAPLQERQRALLKDYKLPARVEAAIEAAWEAGVSPVGLKLGRFYRD